MILLLDLLLDLPKFVHQRGHFCHSIIVLQYSTKRSLAILLLVFLKISETLMTFVSNELIEEILHICIVSHIKC